MQNATCYYVNTTVYKHFKISTKGIKGNCTAKEYVRNRLRIKRSAVVLKKGALNILRGHLDFINSLIICKCFKDWPYLEGGHYPF